MYPTSEIEVIRIQLMEAQIPQQMGEFALVNEREANIAKNVRVIIDNAIRDRADAHYDRDCIRQDRDMAQAALDKAQVALDKAQHAVRYLERRVARLVGENRRLVPSSQPSFIDSCFRYSPLATDYARQNHHRPAQAPCSPTTPTFSPLSSVLSPASMVKPPIDADHNDLSCAGPLGSRPIDGGRPRLPLQPKWALDGVLPNMNMYNIENYSFLGRLEPGVRVGINGVQNPTDLHAYRWRDHLRHLQAQESDARDYYLYGCVNEHVDAILSRQGRYAELVAALFPDAPLDFTLDPPTSKLGSEHMFDVSSVAPGDDVYEEDVARWMYAVLHVSREAARLELEPYFRRRAHYYLALQAWRTVLTKGTISLDAHTPVSIFASRSEMERRFHGCKPFAYPVQDPTLFVLESDNVAWYLPDEEVELEDVAVDLTWLPTCLAREVMARYREFCIAYGV